MARTAAVHGLCFLILVQTLSGCAGMTDQQKSTATGAGAGAVLGAAIGALAGGKNPAVGAAVGAAAGAVAGGLIGWKIGEYRAQKLKSAQQAAASHDYSPQQGIVAKIENTAATPQQLKPGDEIVLRTEYTVMTPPDKGPVKVKEVRTVLFNNQELVRLMKESDLSAGTYASEHPLTLPRDAAEGSYTVKTTVEPVATDKALADQGLAAFMVQRASATPAPARLR